MIRLGSYVKPICSTCGAVAVVEELPACDPSRYACKHGALALDPSRKRRLDYADFGIEAPTRQRRGGSNEWRLSLRANRPNLPRVHMK